MDTILIQLTNQKAAGLLHELEQLNLIKVINGKDGADKLKLSEKYKGIITKAEGKKLNKQTQQMRNEWKGI